MFCTVVFLYLRPKFLKNTFEVVHTYYRSFSRKIHIHMENLLNGYFYCSSFTTNFLNRCFLRTPICSWWKNNQQNLSTLIKSRQQSVGVRNCLLKITSLRAIILHKTDFAIFTVLPCATSWAMCLTDKYLWKSSNMRAQQHLNRSFLWQLLVNVVNYYHKQTYYRCCRGP